jgi:hypothetical protein
MAVLIRHFAKEAASTHFSGIYNGAQLNVVSPNMFAGSIPDLEPDTEHECAFKQSGPDGGDANKTVTVHTRPEPKPFERGRVFHVYPHGYKGDKVQAFEGLLCAYNPTCWGTDRATGAPPRGRPSDRTLVHAGTYKYDRDEYTNNLSVSTVPFDGTGTCYVAASGTPEKPIAIEMFRKSIKRRHSTCG